MIDILLHVADIIFWIIIVSAMIGFTALSIWGLWATRHVPLTARSRQWFMF